MLSWYKFTYEDGRVEEGITNAEEVAVIYPKRDNIKSSITQRFKYEIETLIPPVLYDSPISGERYILPSWTKVHPDTQLSDIEWTRWVSKEEVKVKKQESKKIINTWKFESSSEPGNFYTVTLSGGGVKCNCPGVWRSKTRTCKHMKKVQELLVTQK